MGAKKQKKRMAGMDEAIFEAVAEGLLRFESAQQAAARMLDISKRFIISRDQEGLDANGQPTLKLWIRGFAVTDEERPQGFQGHFARISVQKLPGGKYSLAAEKLPVELRLHPQKIRPRHRHPDNGHRTLKAAQAGKRYSHIDLARQDLLKLHEEFPETSIPGRDKLHLMVYGRGVLPPVRKITLRIAALPDGGFRLEMADNIPMKTPPAGEAKETGGKFSALIALERHKKRPPRKPRG